MKGYYFLNSDKKLVLFVPHNMIVTKKDHVPVEVIFNPNTLSQSRDYSIRNRRNIEQGAKLEIPDVLLERLRHLCFSGRICDAKFEAIGLFRYVEKYFEQLRFPKE